MRITILTIVACCFFALVSFAQNTHSIKGVTADTAVVTKLMTTVTVLNAKDSVLCKFTHATTDGSFTISGLPAGKFLLLVTYPDYADYIEGFDIDPATKERDFGNISMQLKSSVLKEVMIKGTVNGISLKGDTTVVNAKALVIQPNAKVEDLLKQVPGMEVDKDGKIKFQGESVKKVLVDGEEFFGDDPTLVTKNIRGDMVDKFEIFDKKSDQAAFTGVDDGVKNKTINVVLKEDKKTGVFGKVIAGGGAGNGKGFYEGQALYNRFKAKEKYSAYITTANDGTTGLGYADNNKLGTGSDIQISDNIGGVTTYSIGNNDLYYGGTGLPLSRTAGVHYDGKWDTDKASINTNYKLASLGVTSTQNTLTQTSLPAGEINRDNTSNSYNYRSRQKIDLTYQYTFSQTANLKVSANASNQNSEQRDQTLSMVSDAGNVLKSSQNSSQNTHGNQKSVNMSALYSKRFEKAGRTLSWAANDTYTETNSTNNYLSDLYTPADSLHTVIDQLKPTTIKSTVINSNITYSEPLLKSLAVVFNYGLGVNNSTSDIESYNKSGSGKYDMLDSAYSNNYKFNQLTNQLGAIFSYKGGLKTIITLGVKASAVNFKQIDQYTDSVYKRSFVNWLPQAMVQYKVSTSQTITFNYSGRSTQPTIDQIQPIKLNTDALNIYTGNPNLNASFNHNFNLQYSESQFLTSHNFSISGSYSVTTNAIVNNTVTDLTTYTSTINYINLSDKNPYNYYVYMYSSWRVKQLGDMNVGVNLSTSGNVYYNEVNNQLNQSRNQSYSFSLSLGKDKPKKYSINASAGPNYTFNKYSLTPLNNNNAPGFNAYGYTTVYMPWKIQLSSDIMYNYTAKTQNLPATKVTTWNGSVSRTFFKGDNLKASLSGTNLLNQDRNSRSQNNGTITQSTYNTIKRYFLFSLSWDFTKFGTTTAKQ